MTKYVRTKHPNISTYQTRQGKRYRIRKKYYVHSKPKIFDESGKRTIDEAKARLREIEDYIDKNNVGYFQAKKLTINEYYEKMYEHKCSSGQWGAEAQYSIDNIVRNHILPAFGNLTFENLDRQNYQEWIDKKLKTLSRKSVQTIHGYLMTIINDAMYSQIISNNPLIRIHIGESAKPPLNKYISEHDYNIYVNKAEEILNVMDFTMFYLTTFGLRRSEVMGIKKNAIWNKKPHTIVKVKFTRTTRNQKGKRKTKTKTSERFIAVDEKATKYLNEVVKEAQQIKGKNNLFLSDDDLIFINYKTRIPFAVNHLNYIFKILNKATGLNITPHMMRHHFSTQAAIAGVNIEDAARFLGHASKEMTRHYTHIQDETASKVLDLMEEKFKRA
ncbi:MAG: site-specific integrase [Lactobacillales bacterium]|jgi:integrase|nr:site-specific integrase [Lactobacillales bacterium]